MPHTNYFTIRAGNYFDLGKQTGVLFASYVRKALGIHERNEWQHKRKTAKRMFPLAKEVFPQYIEELEGYAAGAGVEPLDLWTLCIEDDADNETSSRCTHVVTNSGHLIGHSEDTNTPGLADTLCVLQKNLPNLTTTELFYYNTLGGTSIGWNSHGYIQALNTLLDSPAQIGIPKNIAGRFLLDTSNPERDIKLLTQYPLASGYNHTFISRGGDVRHIELYDQNAILITPELPFVHSNHCVVRIPPPTTAQSPFRSPASFHIGDVLDANPPEYGTHARYKVASSKVKQTMTPEELMRLLEDTSRGSDKSIFNERTIGRMIIDTLEKKAYMWLLREQEKGWVEYPL